MTTTPHDGDTSTTRALKTYARVIQEFRRILELFAILRAAWGGRRGRRDFGIREPSLNLNRPAAHWTTPADKAAAL